MRLPRRRGGVDTVGGWQAGGVVRRAGVPYANPHASHLLSCGNGGVGGSTLTGPDKLKQLQDRRTKRPLCGKMFPPPGNREANGALEAAAQEVSATPHQVALAWLLQRAPVTLPIPGTSSVAHVEENIAAAAVRLPDAVFERLSAVTPPPASLRG